MKSTPLSRQKIAELYESLIQQLNVLNSSGKVDQLDKDLMKASLRELYLALDQMNVDEPSSQALPSTSEPVIESSLPGILPVVTLEETVLPEPSITEVTAEIISESETPVTVVNTEPVKQPEPVMVSQEPVRSDLQEARKTVYEETIARNGHAHPTIGSTYSAQESLSDRISQNGLPKRLSDQLQNKPLEDLRVSIGLNERFAFINSLFNGNQQNFYAAVDKLNTASSYQDAVIELDLLQSANKWESGNTHLIELTELVKRRFGI